MLWEPLGTAGNERGLTCSNSSVMVLGSSCLWNHIMYLVWNLQDCFFRALAARYWALVPCRGEKQEHVSKLQERRTAPPPMSLWVTSR